MRQALNDQERLNLDRRTAEAEERTGAQIVLAVIERCDAYPELPWKAFALAAAVAGLSVSAANLFRPGWASGTEVLFPVAATLAAGAAAALLCVFLPKFGRLFLDVNRAEAEVRQYAESFFLSRELFATRGRTGLLVLVGLFERHVVVVPDTGLRERLKPEALQGIVSQMAIALSSGRVAAALEGGLAGIEEVLSVSAPDAPGEDELPDEVVEEKGR